ncbi:MAG: TIGR00269 family protein [archaeon]
MHKANQAEKDNEINKCDKCGEKSSITLAYGPHYYCKRHFTQFFEKRFRKTIRKYKLFNQKEKILIALSGGKDSITLLHLLKKYYSKSNEIEALIIDEGVAGYRKKAIKAAIEMCKKLGVKHTIISFKEEFGITNDKIMPLILANPKMGGTCAFCGTLRRNIMNRYAKKMGADKLATGHNLDDEVQSFVMNVFNNDFARMKRMSASSGIIEHKGFVKRIKPLYETPEKEIIAYCALNEIKHYSEECCPYSWTAKRNEYRSMLNHFEERFPGTEHSILRFYENILPLVRPKKSEKQKLSEKLIECKKCGEPTEKEICKACEMIEKIKAEIKNGKLKNLKKSNTTNHTKYNKKLTCVTTKHSAK